MKQILALIFLTLSSFAIAGQGKDGGWPDSIHLLRISKHNLIELLRNATDVDVKDAMNGLRDREEAIRVEDVNRDLLIRLVSKLEDGDVEKIEKSDYKGVRLFHYTYNGEDAIRIYATKNFFTSPRYQVPVKELNAAIIKEVQTLILHEVSHLWGFGEEEEGQINFARTFAVRMINILHGSLKVNFTQEEKLQSLTRAYFFETQNIVEKNGQNYIKGRNYHCVAVNRNGEQASEESFDLDVWKNESDGYPVDGKEARMRWTVDMHLMIENTSWGMGSKALKSTYFEKRGSKRDVLDFKICHQEKKKVDNFVERFVRPYYTRTNLLTDLDNSSLVVYQSLLVNDVHFFADTLFSVLEVGTANQNQIIQNVDFKMKVQMKDVYDRLTSRKYKYSKPQDSADLDKLNSVINSDLSTQGTALYSQISSKIREIDSQLRAMKNISRAYQADSYYKTFIEEFNDIVNRTHKIESERMNSELPCYKEKAVGKFYACQLEASKLDARIRIENYKKMQADVLALARKYENKAFKLKD